MNAYGAARTQRGWQDQPCNEFLPYAIAGRKPTCDKVVPTIHGHARNHLDHQWARVIDGQKVTVTWRRA